MAPLVAWPRGTCWAGWAIGGGKPGGLWGVGVPRAPGGLRELLGDPEFGDCRASPARQAAAGQ